MASDTVLTLNPFDIEVPPRIGFHWPEKATAIGKLMAVDGQQDPIKVRKNGPRAEKPWTLVTGYHRMSGVIVAGLKTVRAIEVSGNPAELKMIEASENMHRRDFGPIEKALFIRAICDIYEERFFEGFEGKSAHEVGALKQRAAGPELGSAPAPKAVLVGNETTKAETEAALGAQAGEAIYGWQDEAAEAIGLSARMMRDYLLIHRAVVSVAGTDESQGGRAHALARHPLGQSKKALLDIAKIPADVRGDIIGLIASDVDGEIGSIAEAKAKWGIGSEKPVTDENAHYYKLTNRIRGNWGRLGAKQKRAFLPGFIKDLSPAMRAFVRDVLDEVDAGDE